MPEFQAGSLAGRLGKSVLRDVGVGQEEMSWNTSVTDTDSSILRRMVTVGVVGERRTADVGCGLLYFTGEACCI